jgi:NAD(P)H dehydrogenase (quinone)
MKTAVLYYSQTGKTKQTAQYIVDGMMSVEDIEAKSFSLENLDMSFIEESKCIVIGTPTYMFDSCTAVHQWMEEPFRKCNMAGKLGGAFATARYIYGGSELAINGILTKMMCAGMLVFSGGFSYGHPIIHIGPVAIDPHIEESADLFRIYGQRMAKKAIDIFVKPPSEIKPLGDSEDW